MTQYFEIEQRDGAARIGKLLLSPEIRTPYILSVSSLGNFESPEPIVDAGSFWSVDSKEELDTRVKKIREKVGDGTLIILPHQAYPPSISSDLREKCGLFSSESTAANEENKYIENESYRNRANEIRINEDIISKNIDSEKVKGPTGSLLRPEGEIFKTDLYIIEGAGILENNARKFLEIILKIKNKISPDTALYAPNLALPENIALLVYLGIDILDDTRSELAAYSDIYLTSSGSFYLDSLAEFPCRCRKCTSITPSELRKLPKLERAEFLTAHNKDSLEAELALVRERIRAGTLREYVEGQCRVRPWLTALLRLGDFEYSYLEERVPAFRQNQLIADTSEALSRIEVVRFAERIQERYIPPDLEILLLLPCSARKPYSTSQSHQKFILSLGKHRRFVHELILTSPLGIVPRELELTYPAAHYDTAVTGHWDEEEKAWVSG
ncbi:MAG: DUF5591 domain-containing protein, partial [Methanosarcina sp.]